MKTITRANLPQQVMYNNKVYQFNAELSGKYSVNKLTALPNDAIKVAVLSRRLRGIIDLHGNYYKPSVFIFTIKATVLK